MIILIEGETYPAEFLEDIFDDPKFYIQNGFKGRIISSGYYHSFEKKNLVFMLPKVFMKEDNNTVFNCSKKDLFNLINQTSVKHKSEFNWIRHLSVLFYKSLLEYKNRCRGLLNRSESFDLNTNINENEYSFLDILLSFVNFYKKNKLHILFKHIEVLSKTAYKPKWEKTIKKSQAVILNNKTPIYTEIINKKKIINPDEELVTYFFSILNYLNKEYQLNLKIDKSFRIIEGKKFQFLCANGLTKLRKIKYRYFNDIQKRMFSLCELYFSNIDKSTYKRKKEEFLSVNSYNLIFEDMIDKLFSDELLNVEINNVTLNGLKQNKDGKIIDHIYDYQSIIDTSSIFYIGDSKYYKSNSEAGRLSRYKQFTYAKNIIQFNIDLFNNRRFYKEEIRYRDSELTEGYNITPNFFIYGYIDDIENYNDHLIDKRGDPVNSFHFEHRLFDRDTLYVHQYKINFLFVLKSYTSFNKNNIEKFRKEVKIRFRNNFIDFFNDTDKCGFEFYEAKIEKENYPSFVERNFKKINGKCFLTNEGKLILAKHIDDNSISYLIENFEKINRLN